MGDTGKDPYFVEGILLLLIGQLLHLDLFQGVDLIIDVPPYLVDNTVGSLS